MTLKVIGAGFGRTGTSSLRDALEQLGFSRCYHMEDVFEHPAHAKVWDKAFAGNPVDWNSFFVGYQSAVDWPACSFYQELADQYSDAKVILTVRDPEKWYASVSATIFRAARSFPLRWLRYVLPRMRAIVRMHDHVIWDGTFDGRFLDKDYAIDVFNRHIAEVMRAIPAERLLVYEVAEGWEPLCRFLDVPIPPDRRFPHVNDTADFQRRIKQLVRMLQLGLVAVLMVAGLAVLRWRSWSFVPADRIWLNSTPRRGS